MPTGRGVSGYRCMFLFGTGRTVKGRTVGAMKSEVSMTSARLTCPELENSYVTKPAAAWTVGRGKENRDEFQ